MSGPSPYLEANLAINSDTAKLSTRNPLPTVMDMLVVIDVYNRNMITIMERILFLHGFTSSGDCEIANTLRTSLKATAEIMAPDLPLYPYTAMDMLKDMCGAERFDLIVGSSCGSFYGQQLVGLTGLPAILVSPFLKMTEFLEPRLGEHEYKSPRADGRQRFKVTQQLVDEFAKMQRHQFDHYSEANRYRVWGMFGSHDTIAHFRNLFVRYYPTAIDYDGPHTMTAENVRHDLVPAILKITEDLNLK